MAFLLFLSGLVASVPAAGSAPVAPGPATADVAPDPRPASASYCEDFAKRQVGLADRLLGQSNYSRALKVLSSTAQNCDRAFVREKLYEVLSAWYDTVRGEGASELRQFIAVLSNQSYLASSQRAQLNQRVQSQVRSLIRREFEGENYDTTHRLCRTFSQYTEERFEPEYYCGTAAEEVGAEGTAMAAYAWLLDNWTEEQSLATWEEVADKLETLYLINGRFQESYALARRIAARDPTPKSVLSSLLSARGTVLAPLMRVGATFYEGQPSEGALSHVDAEMQRVGFPEYVRAFYVIGAEGGVERGMYGTEANAPSTALLEQASGRVSLLRAPDNSNLAWLVSPMGSRFLILEFGVATTPEENVRLESVLSNVESDEQWSQLYELEFTETYPASGSAIGTFLGASAIASGDFGAYEGIFDESSVLTYYCVQSGPSQIEESHNFTRSGLGYGEDEWDRTSNTPALYHHAIQYAGQPVREVVWPTFVDDEWTGVVRIGLDQS